MEAQRRGRHGRRRLAQYGVLAALALGSLWMAAQAIVPASEGAAASGSRRGRPQVDPFRKEPYLIYPGDPTRMQVLWQLVATDTATIAWGLDSTYATGSLQTTEYGIDHQHTATLTNLVPGTRYEYRVNVRGTVHGGNFNAAPSPDATRLTFLAYGDTRSYPAVHDQVAAAMLATLAGHPEDQTLAIVTGDLVGNGTVETDWTNQFFSPSYPHIRELLARLPYQSCIGNHEGAGNLFVKYFPYPFVGGRYWSFDYGPAHFAVVDQYTNYAAGSPQLQWLTNDLAASDKAWKFIVLHEPGWSSGGDHPNNTFVQQYIQPLCTQYGVKVVFGGHNHYYARAVVDGVQHLTIGGGGAPLYTPVTNYPDVVASARAYHYCTAQIEGARLHMEARTPAGALLDSFTVWSSVPVALSDFNAEADSDAVSLRWRAQLDRQTQFRVERSNRADGDYTPIGKPLEAAPGTRSFTWRDADVRPATEYFYRIGWSETGAWSYSAPVRIVTHPARFGFRSLAPNPFGRGLEQFEFVLPKAGRARLDLYDVAGKLTCTVADARFDAGVHTVTWDGRTPAGDPVATGIYYARLVADQRTAIRKLAIVR